MSKKTVKHQVDFASLPSLSANQKAELAVRSDGEVDYGDVFPLMAEFLEACRARQVL